jgi:hypothetical protein
VEAGAAERERRLSPVIRWRDFFLKAETIQQHRLPQFLNQQEQSNYFLWNLQGPLWEDRLPDAPFGETHDEMDDPRIHRSFRAHRQDRLGPGAI